MWACVLITQLEKSIAINNVNALEFQRQAAISQVSAYNLREDTIINKTKNRRPRTRRFDLISMRYF